MDQVTNVMELITDHDVGRRQVNGDFQLDHLVILKQLLLSSEEQVDGIPLEENREGCNFNGNYMFELLEKAGVRILKDC